MLHEANAMIATMLLIFSDAAYGQAGINDVCLVSLVPDGSGRMKIVRSGKGCSQGSKTVDDIFSDLKRKVKSATERTHPVIKTTAEPIRVKVTSSETGSGFRTHTKVSHGTTTSNFKTTANVAFTTTEKPTTNLLTTSHFIPTTSQTTEQTLEETTESITIADLPVPTSSISTTESVKTPLATTEEFTPPTTEISKTDYCKSSPSLTTESDATTTEEPTTLKLTPVPTTTAAKLEVTTSILTTEETITEETSAISEPTTKESFTTSYIESTAEHTTEFAPTTKAAFTTHKSAEDVTTSEITFGKIGTTPYIASTGLRTTESISAERTTTTIVESSVDVISASVDSDVGFTTTEDSTKFETITGSVNTTLEYIPVDLTSFGDLESSGITTVNDKTEFDTSTGLVIATGKSTTVDFTTPRDSDLSETTTVPDTMESETIIGSATTTLEFGHTTSKDSDSPGTASPIDTTKFETTTVSTVTAFISTSAALSLGYSDTLGTTKAPASMNFKKSETTAFRTKGSTTEEIATATTFITNQETIGSSYSVAEVVTTTQELDPAIESISWISSGETMSSSSEFDGTTKYETTVRSAVTMLESANVYHTFLENSDSTKHETTTGSEGTTLEPMTVDLTTSGDFESSGTTSLNDKREVDASKGLVITIGESTTDSYTLPRDSDFSETTTVPDTTKFETTTVSTVLSISAAFSSGDPDTLGTTNAPASMNLKESGTPAFQSKGSVTKETATAITFITNQETIGSSYSVAEVITTTQELDPATEPISWISSGETMTSGSEFDVPLTSVVSELPAEETQNGTIEDAEIASFSTATQETTGPSHSVPEIIASTHEVQFTTEPTSWISSGDMTTSDGDVNGDITESWDSSSEGQLSGSSETTATTKTTAIGFDFSGNDESSGTVQTEYFFSSAFTTAANWFDFSEDDDFSGTTSQSEFSTAENLLDLSGNNESIATTVQTELEMTNATQSVNEIETTQGTTTTSLKTHSIQVEFSETTSVFMTEHADTTATIHSVSGQVETTTSLSAVIELVGNSSVSCQDIMNIKYVSAGKATSPSYNSECEVIHCEICFWTVVQYGDWYTAQDICGKSGASLANIYNEELFDAIVENLFAKNVNGYIWTGMRFEENTTTLSNGYPATFVKWEPGQPSYGSTSHTVIDFGVSSYSNFSEGMWNWYPDDVNDAGFVCELN